MVGLTPEREAIPGFRSKVVEVLINGFHIFHVRILERPRANAEILPHFVLIKREWRSWHSTLDVPAEDNLRC